METEYLKVSVLGAISYHFYARKFDESIEYAKKYGRHYDETRKDKIVDLSPMDSVPAHNIENLLRVLTGNRPRGLRAKKEMSEEAYNAAFVEIAEIAELAKKALVRVESGIYANKNGLTYSNEWRIKRSNQLGDEKWQSFQWKGDNGWVSVSLFNKTGFAWSEFNWNKVWKMSGEYIGNVAEALSVLSGIKRKELKNHSIFEVFTLAYKADETKKNEVIENLLFKVPAFVKNIIKDGEANLPRGDEDVSMKAADKVCKRDMILYIPISKNVKSVLKKKYATFLDGGVAEVIGFVKDYEVPSDAKPAFLTNNQQKEKI